MFKKKVMLGLASLLTIATLLAGCGTDEKEKSGEEVKKSDLKVGMVTDSGTIDDKSFNQGTWEGILAAKESLGIQEKYLKPSGEIESEYLKEIANLYDAGFKFIVTPGFKFETAIYQAQTKYEDAKFVILDGNPHKGDFVPEVATNTVSIFFAEHESGFLAGVATALELKEGEAGFIGGMEIPAVQKFNWGFQQGLTYANENLGTNLTIKAENVIYQGTFDDVAAGGQIAAQMFNKGIDVIFAAAGGVGIGAINEAKTRVSKGENVWIVGVDVDQYADGEYEDGKSVILTSATKKLSHATQELIEQELNGEFPGGETIIYSVENDGVGIPEENPNLSEDTVTKVKDVYEKIKSGEIVVSAEQGDLFK
ncbi:BMP family lipoprotein [Bacillus timonensis]|uniref:BMP family lipoprotein n=1 Tax=Bacillus timonensis TaxID=1033734 RepID=UPI0002882053|nr:BMP family protein [Bacillus timonensis]